MVSRLGWIPPRVKRAGLVVEFEDGTKMVYAMGSPVTLEVEAEEPEVFRDFVVSSYSFRNYLTVTGPFIGGQIWKDGVPGHEQPSIDTPRQEITS